MRYSCVPSEAAHSEDKFEKNSYPTLSREDSEKSEKSPLSSKGDVGQRLSPRSSSSTCISGRSTLADSFSHWEEVDPSFASLGDWEASETSTAVLSRDEVAEPEAEFMGESQNFELSSKSLRASRRADEKAPESAAKKGWWRLVWCHERCHKADSDAQRQMLARHAEALGGSLITLKKASKFQIWLRRHERPPYILLTDWREVKPCRDYLAEMPKRSLPALTVVHCEVQCHFDRASEWATSLDPSSGQGEVHVCQRYDLADLFFNSLQQLMAAEIGAADSTEQETGMDNLAMKRNSSIAPTSVVSRQDDAPHLFFPVDSSRQLRKSEQDLGSFKELTGVAPFCALFAEGKTTAWQRSIPHSGTLLLEAVPVWPFMQLELPSANHALEMMLKEAMPQQYED